MKDSVQQSAIKSLTEFRFLVIQNQDFLIWSELLAHAVASKVLIRLDGI